MDMIQIYDLVDHLGSTEISPMVNVLVFIVVGFCKSLVIK